MRPDRHAPPRQEARREVFCPGFAGVRRPPSGFRLQAINLFGGIGLCQIGCDTLIGFARKSFQIGLLGSGHLLVAGNPIIGALYRLL